MSYGWDLRWDLEPIMIPPSVLSEIFGMDLGRFPVFKSTSTRGIHRNKSIYGLLVVRF